MAAGRRQRAGFSLAPQATCAGGPPSHAVPDRERAAWREEIQRALDMLDDDQREAFLLKHVEELGYEEISELTGVGVSALKMRVKRACERLRVLLQEANSV